MVDGGVGGLVEVDGDGGPRSTKVWKGGWCVALSVSGVRVCAKAFVVVAGAPARSRRLRVREVREVERGVGRLVEVDGG